MTDDAVLKVIRDVGLALARKLTAEGRGAEVEAVMQAVVDPIYAEASKADTMMRLLEFCEDMRAITGLPDLSRFGVDNEGPARAAD